MSQLPTQNPLPVDIEPQSDLQRKSDLLRPLNNALLALTLVGLTITLLNKPEGLWVVGVSLLVNVAVAWLDRTSQTLLAAHIFTYWINIGILTYLYINLYIEQNLPLGILFACVLAMSVMLAGMLLGVHYVAGLVTFNVVTLIGPGPSHLILHSHRV